MIVLGSDKMAPEHQQLHTLLEYLKETYPIRGYTIKITFDYSVSHYLVFKVKSTGKVKVSGQVATILVAAKGRSPRAVALTTAHEYKHCLQFIIDDLFMSTENKKLLEDEAISFAEDAIKTLWKEQKIYFPSS